MEARGSNGAMFGVCLAFMLGSCATARDVATGTKNAVSESVARAAVDFAAYDREHQMELVRNASNRDAALTAIETWQGGPQKKIRQGFFAVVAALEAIDLALRVTDTGAQQRDWHALTRGVAEASRTLQKTFSEVGVPVAFTVPTIAAAGAD